MKDVGVKVRVMMTPGVMVEVMVVLGVYVVVLRTPGVVVEVSVEMGVNVLVSKTPGVVVTVVVELGVSVPVLVIEGVVVACGCGWMQEHLVEAASLASAFSVERRFDRRSFFTSVGADRFRFPVNGGSTVTVVVVVEMVEVV